MSDKMRTTFPITVTMADGEQPPARKINSIATQAKNGLAIVERAIGDLWNQSGDSITSDYPNRITNLARTIGDQSLLNAKLPSPDFSGTTSVLVRQTIDRGITEISLDFTPIDDATLQTSVQSLYGNSTFYTGSNVARDALTSDTAWHLETDTSKIMLGSAIHATSGLSYLEYNVAAADFPTDAATDSAFSMIPHPAQSDWNGLKISQISAGKYYLTLPFRRPGTDISGNSKIPTGSGNIASIASPSVKRYWGPDTAGYAFTSGVSNTRFYRYTLPQIVQDMFTSPVAGTVIPAGTLYLWDNTTETIIEGVTFKVPQAPMTLFGAQVSWVIQADGVALDQLFTGYTSSASTEAAADYQSRFSLICVGSSLAEAISQLRLELTEGDKLTGIQKKIAHTELIDLQPVQGTRHATNMPPSFVENDDHSYLLSRLGSQASASTSLHRDRFNNGIKGDLLLLSTNSTSNYQNLSANSNKIFFGSHSPTSPSIYGTPNVVASGLYNTTNALTIDDAVLGVSSGVILGQSLYAYFWDNKDFGLFDDGLDLAGRLWTQQALFNGTTDNMQTFDGTINSTRYIHIDSSSSNLIKFKGNRLDLSAVPADTNEVVIGYSNSNTDLRIYNNQINFGAGPSTDTGSLQVEFDIGSGDTIYTFEADMLAGLSYVQADILYARSNTIQFGAYGVSNDWLSFSDSTNTITAIVDSSVNNSIIEAGALRTTASGIYFGSGTTQSLTYNSGTDEFVFAGFTKASEHHFTTTKAISHNVSGNVTRHSGSYGSVTSTGIRYQRTGMTNPGFDEVAAYSFPTMPMAFTPASGTVYVSNASAVNVRIRVEINQITDSGVGVTTISRTTLEADNSSNITSVNIWKVLLDLNGGTSVLVPSQRYEISVQVEPVTNGNVDVFILDVFIDGTIDGSFT